MVLIYYGAIRMVLIYYPHPVDLLICADKTFAHLRRPVGVLAGLAWPGSSVDSLCLFSAVDQAPRSTKYKGVWHQCDEILPSNSSQSRVDSRQVQSKISSYVLSFF